MPPSESQKCQIVEVLKQRYFPIILPIPQNWTPEQHEKNRISRSLTALSIEKLAEIDPLMAVNALMDGGNDNGIDAMYFDRPQKKLWLVQAKAGGAPDMGENKKFCDGIRDLIGGRYDKFNEMFARFEEDIEIALGTDGLMIVGCDVHLGEGLGPHAIVDLDQLKTELNRFGERFQWKDINLSAVHGWLTNEHEIEAVNTTMTLEKWYGVEQPRRAFYGLVSAAELAALYQQHGKALFEKNIRHYLGAYAVNVSIAETVQHRPAELFYLNNGLTAVCSAIRHAPGATSDLGQFVLEGFSVVNGAQTVGSIATVQTTAGAISPDAKLLITLIEVGCAPDNLGPQITEARNTQNAVKGLHFAALDPHQERLRRELAVSEVLYYYRPSAEAVQGGPNVITVEQAAIALASFSGKTRVVVAAKKDSRQIYDRKGEFYPILFRADLSAVQLCRAVKIYDYLNRIFENSEMAEANYSRRRMFYRHGRLFILHILARRHRPLIEKAEKDLSESDKSELSRIALESAELIYTAAEAMFQQVIGYLSIFRNTGDAEMLASDVMQRLAQQDVQKQKSMQAVVTSSSDQLQASSGAPPA